MGLSFFQRAPALNLFPVVTSMKMKLPFPIVHASLYTQLRSIRISNCSRRLQCTTAESAVALKMERARSKPETELSYHKHKCCHLESFCSACPSHFGVRPFFMTQSPAGKAGNKYPLLQLLCLRLGLIVSTTAPTVWYRFAGMKYLT